MNYFTTAAGLALVFFFILILFWWAYMEYENNVDTICVNRCGIVTDFKCLGEFAALERELDELIRAYIAEQAFCSDIGAALFEKIEQTIEKLAKTIANCYGEEIAKDYVQAKLIVYQKLREYLDYFTAKDECEEDKVSKAWCLSQGLDAELKTAFILAKANNCLDDTELSDNRKKHWQLLFDLTNTSGYSGLTIYDQLTATTIEYTKLVTKCTEKDKECLKFFN